MLKASLLLCRHGNFGACFFSTPAGEVPAIYASRPGLRIWRASLEGKVSTTMIFKDSISKGEPEISTLNLPSKNGENGMQSETKQFGPLRVFSDYFLLSWQGSCVWVIDPNKGMMVGCHSNFGCVVDVATYDNEIFVLTKGDKTFVRKIALEARAQSPLIEVKELDLNQDENEANTIQRSGSVNQFEETDKLDKLFGEMKNTTVGLIGVVRRNVVKTIGHIKNFDDSEEDKSSLSDNQWSESSTSPSTEEERNTNGERSVQNGEACNEAATGRPEIEQEGDVRVVEAGGSIPLDLSDSFKDAHDAVPESNTSEIEVILKHAMKEEPLPFHHLSGKAFSSDIVFEGTSKQKQKRKKPKKKGTSRFPSPTFSTLIIKVRNLYCLERFSSCLILILLNV